MIDEKELLNTQTRNRRYTRVLLDALLNKDLSKEEAVAMFINYLTDEDIECVLRDNSVIPTDDDWRRPKGSR